MNRRTFLGVQAAFLASASKVAVKILAEPEPTTATAVLVEQQMSALMAHTSEIAVWDRAALEESLLEWSEIRRQLAAGEVARYHGIYISTRRDDDE